MRSPGLMLPARSQTFAIVEASSALSEQIKTRCLTAIVGAVLSQRNPWDAIPTKVLANCPWVLVIGGCGHQELRGREISQFGNAPKTIGSRITDILLPLCYGRTESNHTVGTPGSVVRRACGFLVCGEQEVSHRSLCVRVP